MVRNQNQNVVATPHIYRATTTPPNLKSISLFSPPPQPPPSSSRSRRTGTGTLLPPRLVSDSVKVPGLSAWQARLNSVSPESMHVSAAAGSSQVQDDDDDDDDDEEEDDDDDDDYVTNLGNSLQQHCLLR